MPFPAGPETGEAQVPIRVLIADDHGVVRHGLKMYMADDPDFVVVGEARTGREAVTLSMFETRHASHSAANDGC